MERHLSPFPETTQKNRVTTSSISTNKLDRLCEREGTSRRLSTFASLGLLSGGIAFLENKLKKSRVTRPRPPEFNYSDRVIRPNERHLCVVRVALHVMSHPIFICSIHLCHRLSCLFLLFFRPLLSFFHRAASRQLNSCRLIDDNDRWIRRNIG